MCLTVNSLFQDTKPAYGNDLYHIVDRYSEPVDRYSEPESEKELQHGEDTCTEVE